MEYELLMGLLWRVRQDWAVLGEAEQDQLLPLFRHSLALQQDYCWRQILTRILNRAFTKD